MCKTVTHLDVCFQGTSFLTAHENGSLNLHTLQLTEDLGLYKAKGMLTSEDTV